MTGLIGPIPGPLRWLALLVAGQVASLQLIQAGNLVGYQHYVETGQLLDTPFAWAAAFLVLQALAVSLGLWRVRLALSALLRSVAPWRLAVVAAVFVFTSATLSREPTVFASELVLASLIQAIHLATVALFALALDANRAAAAAPGWIRPAEGPEEWVPEPGGGDRFAWGLALSVAVVAALLAAFSYQRHPHVPDEVVYLLQARYLAAGMLTMPLPPVPEAFNVDLMTYQATRWFSPVPPGWPFLLAVGAFFNVPWLVNPVLGGANILLAHALLSELYPRRTVRLTLVLLATSPWHLFMAMNFMTHTATLTFALLAAWSVARLRRDPRLRWALLGGLGLGVVGLIRPLEGLAIAPLLGLWSLGARGVRWRLAPAAALTASSIMIGAMVLPYNRHLTDSATAFPIMEYTDLHYGPGTNALGFGPNRGLGWPGLDPIPGHGAVDVAVNANFNLFQTNTELHGWATGSLVLLTLFLLAGPKRREDWWLVAVIVAVAGIHSLYYFSGGPDFGARYWYLILVPCLVLTARGLEWLAGMAATREPGGGIRVHAAAGALILVTLVAFVPWRATDKYHHYRGMRPDARTLAREHAIGDGVVLIRGNRHPDYASAVVYNPLNPTDRQALYTWDRGAEVRERLVQAYPDRRFWIVDGPTVTGASYTVRHGPLTGSQLRAMPDSAVPVP